MKILSVFLISLCAFNVLFSALTVTEARPLALIFESGSNWLINIDPEVKVFRPPTSAPPPPKSNTPTGPGLSTDHPQVKSPPPNVIAYKISKDFVPNHNTAST